MAAHRRRSRGGGGGKPTAGAASSSSSPTASSVKLGPNGAVFVSSGIPDLGSFVAVILGGGFVICLVVMVMEDSDAPHHLLLLRAFISQGVVHKQPLLFAKPMKEPRSFLSALPAPLMSSKEESCQRAIEEQVLVMRV
nr:elongator complex protein 4-like [Lolium perenne]